MEATIKDILGNLLQLLGLPVDELTVSEEKEGIIRVDIASNNASRIIGWHGETLQAVEHLVKSLIRAKEKMEKSPFIVLDVDGYRRMQEEKVCKIAEQKADFVRRTGSRVALSPMSPYMRRIVHLYVAATPALADLTTESVGEGEYRQIVLRMKSEQDRGSEELSPTMGGEEGFGNLDV